MMMSRWSCRLLMQHMHLPHVLPQHFHAQLMLCSSSSSIFPFRSVVSSLEQYNGSILLECCHALLLCAVVRYLL